MTWVADPINGGVKSKTEFNWKVELASSKAYYAGQQKRAEKKKSVALYTSDKVPTAKKSIKSIWVQIRCYKQV